MSREVTPEQFGAIGDGVRDDTAAIQKALDRAQGGRVRLGSAAYAVSDTLLVPTSCTLDGAGAVITSLAHNRPILASKAWATRAPVRGSTRISQLTLRGTGRGPDQAGCILHDYWSEVADVQIENVGGRGLVFAEQTRDGDRPSSTLVENRVRNCIVRDARRSAFWFGEEANGKLTDGAVIDCIASQHESAREPTVSIGHAAGWIVDGLHTYGGGAQSALFLGNAYFANVANLYVEAFAGSAIYLSGLQTTATFSNVHVLGGEQAGQSAFLAASGHPDFEGSTVLLSNVALWQSRPRPITAVAMTGKQVMISGTATIAGPGAAMVQPGALRRGHVEVRTGSERAGPVHSWEGRAQRQFTLASRDLREPFELAFLVAITGRSTDGGLTTSYAGMVHWARIHAGGPALADLVDTAPRRGFERGPDLITERRGDEISISVAFMPVASGPGQLSISPA
jgi:hypothetical protein